MNLERLNEIENPLLHIVKHDVVPALGYRTHFSCSGIRYSGEIFRQNT